MRENIQKKLDRIEMRIFAIEMIDHWTDADREKLRSLEAERRELMAELATVED